MVDELVWGSRFRVHHRIADSFRDGRILLAGDAAHVHSPAGGQGMNLGIEDAVKLGEVLSRVLSGESTDLLDEYAAARHQTAEAVISLAGRLTDLATASARLRPIRNLAMRVAGKIPAVRQPARLATVRPGPSLKGIGMKLVNDQQAVKVSLTAPTVNGFLSSRPRSAAGSAPCRCRHESAIACWTA